MTTRTYSELVQIPDFVGRYEYLRLGSAIGDETFGFQRWINQGFYTSREWRNLRHHIISRDNGCDLGVEGFDIYENTHIHHLNPMTLEDFENSNPWILDPENLITVTQNTHNAIHFGNVNLLRLPIQERKPGDTRLWGGGR